MYSGIKICQTGSVQPSDSKELFKNLLLKKEKDKVSDNS